MLQRYTFINHPVNEYNKGLFIFFRNIENVGSADIFDPKKYFPSILAKKAKKNNKLYKKSEAFFNKYKRLRKTKKNVFDAFFNMNKIDDMFQNKSPRVTKKDLPPSIRKETDDLFKHLYYNTLKNEIKSHYEKFVELQDNNWCAFCGMEQLQHFTHQKQDYDHLLTRVTYPFAAINMKNLAPMGLKCNRTHKKTKDLILSLGRQCKGVNPYYRKITVKINFKGTLLPSALDRKGKWSIEFSPKCEEVTRWNEVFNIEDRIIKDLFTSGKKTDFDLWIDDFVKIYRRKKRLSPMSEPQVRNAFKEYAKSFISERYRDKRYVKYHLFMWISTKASSSFIKARQRALNYNA